MGRRRHILDGDRKTQPYQSVIEGDVVKILSDPKVTSLTEAARMIGRDRGTVGAYFNDNREKIVATRSENLDRKHQLLDSFEEQTRKFSRALERLEPEGMAVNEVAGLFKLFHEARKNEAEYRRANPESQISGEEAKEAYYRAVRRGIRIGGYLAWRSIRCLAASGVPGNGKGLLNPGAEVPHSDIVDDLVEGLAVVSGEDLEQEDESVDLGVVVEGGVHPDLGLLVAGDGEDEF